ncbi:MAG: hypothetical protein AAF708_00415 [Deinococcota bacterium]
MTENDFARLKRSTSHAADIARGEREPSRVTVINPADIFPTVKFRHEHNLSHDDLASILGVTVDDVIDWEVDEAKPSAPVQLLLELLITNPELVIETAKGLQRPIPDSLTASP